MKKTDRAENDATVCNHIHNGMQRPVTRRQALDAADYWQEQYCKKADEINGLRGELLEFTMRQILVSKDEKRGRKNNSHFPQL